MKAGMKFRRFGGDLVNWPNLDVVMVEDIEGSSQVIEQAVCDTALPGAPPNAPGSGLLSERSPGREIPAAAADADK